MRTAFIFIIVAAALIGGAVILVGSNINNTSSGATNNISVIDGKQIITIKAKGGYFPKVTAAEAGVPTVIKVVTQGTFDCSSALTIPSIGYRKNLPPTGVTEIEVPTQKTKMSIRGICAMGMYNFTVNFD